MKKCLLLIILLCCVFIGDAQVNIPTREIKYNVNYHWGLIDVMIAKGTVTLQTDGDRFDATLDGSSIPWEGRVFCVSDTLRTIMTPGSGLSKETVVYENGWYLKPKVTAYHSGNFDPSDPSNYKNIKGEGSLDASDDTMEAITVTADMLGMFYYFQEMDLQRMSAGESVTIPIEVEGGEPERVVVTFLGKSQYKIDDKVYPTYEMQFEYSYHGEMSGYPVKAQVGVDDRIPLLLSSTLPAGHVEMIYNP
ncbi:MAG: DUF3108 domain-containing protein [Muribaculaceae bacterium]|nr:DUF3108 domain-containing protein [Muribaculaceae bacterium]